MLDTYFVSNLCYYVSHCIEHLLPYSFLKNFCCIFLFLGVLLLFLRPMVMTGSSAIQVATYRVKGMFSLSATVPYREISKAWLV